MTISGLSCHGNPLHPNPHVAKKAHDVWRKTVLLAEKLEVPVINGFSGCPGDHLNAKYPNWVTCAWPPEYKEMLGLAMERGCHSLLEERSSLRTASRN